MDQLKSAKDTGLEDELRGMILSNVRIGTSPADPQGHRGRGRARGGFWRGADRHGQHSLQDHSSSHHGASSPGASRARGRGHFHHHGHHGHHHGQHDAHAEQTPPFQQSPGLTPNMGNHGTPHMHRQHHHQHYPPQSEHNVGHRHGPRILHRPHDRGSPSLQGHMNPAPGSHPRGQAQSHSHSHLHQSREDPMVQVQHLEVVAAHEIPQVEMSLAELEAKEAFRQQLEATLQQAFTEGYSGDIDTISLVGFGSLASGFGIPGSDMDLAVVPRWKDPAKVDQTNIDRDIPRLLERAVLDAKMGGRLLTRTRVPILKVCQRPTEALFTALFEERKKWDELPEKEKYPTEVPQERSMLAKSSGEPEPEKVNANSHHTESSGFDEAFPAIGAAPKKKQRAKAAEPQQSKPIIDQSELKSSVKAKVDEEPKPTITTNEQQPRAEKAWMREKVLGPLDFPKSGCGIQCDLNFGNPLGIYNTRMLRCYSLTDPRVRPIVLFVKSWAKRRKINSAYSGTLSSYGWVLMVLHYLVNVAQPPVCPNLQHSIPPPKDVTQLENFFRDPVIDGYTVRFWNNEAEIVQAAHAGHLTQNREPIGALLRGFFQYFASLSGYGPGPRVAQFHWTSEVLSLRTRGGLTTKQSKGWVSAKTTVTAEKKVTNRYLFAIEDPFEIDHNVARTVTYRGIVAIRDEFRRAWRVLQAIGRGTDPEGGLFDEVDEGGDMKDAVKVQKEDEADKKEGNMTETGGTTEKEPGRGSEVGVEQGKQTEVE